MENRPVLTEREILRNLQAIVSDADELPIQEVLISVHESCLDSDPLFRLLETQLVCFQPKTGRIGPPSANLSQEIGITSLVWKL